MNYCYTSPEMGGLNKFSQTLIHEFEKKGFGVVALNTRKYFRIKKTPDNFAADVNQLVNHYMSEWGKNSFIIVGYSFGADVAAFLPKRLPDTLIAKMHRIALLSPSASTNFVIDLEDLIGDSRNIKRKYKVGPELKGSKLPVVCIFGEEEDLILKNTLQDEKNIILHQLPGKHHYKNDIALLIKMIGL